MIDRSAFLFGRPDQNLVDCDFARPRDDRANRIGDVLSGHRLTELAADALEAARAQQCDDGTAAVLSQVDCWLQPPSPGDAPD